MSTRGLLPSSRTLAFVYLMVQRASRSFCRSLAGLSCQPSGMRPSLIACFSAFVFRCLGAATIEALLAEDGFAELVESYKALAELPAEEQTARLVKLARLAIENALADWDIERFAFQSGAR